MSFSFLRGMALTVALAAMPATAGTLLIGTITGPNGGNGTSQLPDGTSSDGASWTGVGAGVIGDDLSLYGDFSCSVACNDYFSVNFGGFGYTPGTTAYISVFGAGLDFSFTLDALDYGTNQTLGFLSETGTDGGETNRTITFATISDSSIPVVIDNAGGFNGTLTLDLMAGAVNLPASATADLILNSVPEPGTLAIAAACILLLVYVKRLRKA